jgi:uncharacterized protein YndB with AHSA1/START domain
MAIRGIETGANALRSSLEIQAEASSRATPEVVYEALADLQSHLEWGGHRQPAKMRLLTMDAPPGLATTGTEFVTTGSDPNGMFSDRSVVTEATPGRAFEFVTDAALTPKRGGRPVEATIVHRYEIASADSGGSRVSYRYRVTRISHLIGPLRLLRTPLAGVVKKVWVLVARRGLRNLIAVADVRSQA